MKSIERHKLKENEFAQTVANARDVLQTRGQGHGDGRDRRRRRDCPVRGFSAGGASRETRKPTTLLASALAVAEAPVVRSAAAGAGQPAAGAAARHVPHRTRALEAALPTSARPPTLTRTPTRASRRAITRLACSPSSDATPRPNSAIRKSSTRRVASIYARTAQARARRRAAGAGEVRQRDHDLSGATDRPNRSCRSMAC